MISTALPRAAIITQLKADAALTALVGTNVREESYMSRTYDYPNVRVFIVRLSPLTVSSNCDMFECEFSVAYRDEDPSSKGCADGMSVASEALVNTRLAGGADFTSVTRVKLVNVGDPAPESEEAWLARSFFSFRLREL